MTSGDDPVTSLCFVRFLEIFDNNYDSMSDSGSNNYGRYVAQCKTLSHNKFKNSKLIRRLLFLLDFQQKEASSYLPGEEEEEEEEEDDDEDDEYESRSWRR